MEKSEVQLIIAAIETTKADLKSEILDVKTNLSKQSHTIYGNGRPGLTTAVNLLEQELSSLQKEILEMRRFRRNMLLTFLGSAVTVGLTIYAGTH